MAVVPDTSTFTLNDVYSAVGYTSLYDCFTYANASYFDSNYSGSKNSLLNFRNYGPKDSISLSPDFLNVGYWGSSSYVYVTSSGSWTATLNYDPNSMINSYTTAGGSSGYFWIYYNDNTNPGFDMRNCDFTFTCGTANTWLYVCQDGYQYTCNIV